MLAIVSDRRRTYEKEIAKLDTRKELAAQKVKKKKSEKFYLSPQIQTILSGGGEAMEDDTGLPDDPEKLQVVIEEAEAAVLGLRELVTTENEKMERYRVRKRNKERRWVLLSSHFNQAKPSSFTAYSCCIKLSYYFK